MVARRNFSCRGWLKGMEMIECFGESPLCEREGRLIGFFREGFSLFQFFVGGLGDRERKRRGSP